MKHSERANHIHELNQKWWTNVETGEREQQNIGKKLMLVVSELSEAMEGVRKNLMDDKLPHRKMEEVELADAEIRLFDIVGSLLWDIKHQQGEAEHMATCERVDRFMTDLASDRDMSKVLRKDKGETLFVLVCQVTYAYEEYFEHGVNGLISGLLKSIDAIEMVAIAWELDLWGAVDEKCEYNRTRPDHQIENRKMEHGKKW